MRKIRLGVCILDPSAYGLGNARAEELWVEIGESGKRTHLIALTSLPYTRLDSVYSNKLFNSK